MKIKFLLGLLFFVFSTSCNVGIKQKKEEQNNTTPKDTTPAAAKEKFETGAVIDKIITLADASQSYSLYLPKNYDSHKTYAVIFAFDPHGTGKLPVDKYKTLAEQYNFILIGSNNSKNGLQFEESKEIAEKLFADAQMRLSVNTARIYLLGFSGGARVANGLTITNGAIAVNTNSAVQHIDHADVVLCSHRKKYRNILLLQIQKKT